MALRKGVVLEIEGSEAIILTDRGEFQRIAINKRNLQVGMEITLPTHRSYLRNFGKSWNNWLAGAVAAVMLLAINPLASLVQAQAGEVVAFVDIDINPSIQLSVNKYEKVVAAEPMNDDGKKILAEIRVVGDDVDDAAARITEQAIQDGFINKHRRNEVKIALSPALGLALEEDWDVALKESVTDVLEDESQVAIVDTVKSSAELRLSAKKQGLSVGKFMVLLAAKEKNLPITVAEVKAKPITDIILAKGADPADLNKTEHTANEWDQIAAKYEPELSDEPGVQVAMQPTENANSNGTAQDKPSIAPGLDMPKDPAGVVSIAGVVYGNNKTKKSKETSSPALANEYSKPDPAADASNPTGAEINPEPASQPNAEKAQEPQPEAESVTVPAGSASVQSVND